MSAKRRNILFITTDQQRFDALGCNGGQVARTPVADGLAADGINYTRAHPQNVVCMPSRSTMVTGQHVRSHGVWMNGVPLPVDSPSVVRELNDHGYRTALIGKAHFEPVLDLSFYENRMAGAGEHGPHRGFDHMELAMHGPVPFTHYGVWLRSNAPDAGLGYYPVLDNELQVNAAGGGETGAPQVHLNPIPRERYHTDWVADRTTAWLDGLDDEADWFCWMSFPDPHHPWDPPASELHRVDWRELDLPANYPIEAAAREAIIDGKPRHWRLWYDGDLVANFEAPPQWTPASLTPDQVREVNARIHVENELIDEACGRVLARIDERGWRDETDVFFTTDHGELQGDFGLLFKGPYHVDALMRLPLIWRPAPAAAVTPASVDRPVGLLDLAATWCNVAGIPVPEWIEGRPLPKDNADADAQRRDRVITEWDSEHPAGEMHLRTVFRDGVLCTAYEPGTVHDGTEGELYDMNDDPLQRHNRWDDPQYKALRGDLVADLYDSLPEPREPKLAAVAPV